jgi:hypothetical protein
LSYVKRDRKDLSSAVFNVRRTSPFVASAVQPWLTVLIASVVLCTVRFHVDIFCYYVFEEFVP